jgi:hypothetical protein
MEKQVELQDMPEKSITPVPRRKYWIGRNQTEFVQLIYALVRAERLSNDRIEEMVEVLAEFMGINLSRHWQSNLSKSIHNTNNDYEPPLLKALDLMSAWKDYANEQKDKLL